jgi:glycosyltransferase involved in cell wall biosynthesis
VQKRIANLRMMIPAPLKHLVRPLRDRSVAWWHSHVNPGFARRIRRYDAALAPEVSIIIITYNRLRMLRECMKSLLEKTTGDEFEIIVWDNASTDGTGEYLDELAAAHAYLRVIHHPKNVGLNGVALSVQLARGLYIVEMDDDVLSFPDDWLPYMLHAFKAIPRAGYLAANVVQDEITNGNKPGVENYRAVDHDGIVVEHWATDKACVGGWCTMTSLEVLNSVGNFPRRRRRVFFSEDGDYGRRCRKAGLVAGILRDVVVYHACGPAANDLYGCLEVCRDKYSDGPEYGHQHSGLQEYSEGRDPTGQRFKRR